jgi:hypothetical protein
MPLMTKMHPVTMGLATAITVVVHLTEVTVLVNPDLTMMAMIKVFV